MRIAYLVGARPNFVKMAPVMLEMRRRLPEAGHLLIHTGQHYDRLMSEVLLEQLGVPKLGIPLVHVESGLRSFDRTMPEEINRIVADEFSDYLFVHCEEAVENLRAEGISDARMHFVGNTMIDSLVTMEERFRSLEAAASLGLTPGSYLLVTLHRPALVDGPLMASVLERLQKLSRELPVVFPVHPRTRKMVNLLGSTSMTQLRLIEPVSYLEFLSLEADAAAVLTDSGGVQEETTYLGVPCFTLRENTERPVTVRAGTNTLLGLDPGRIDEIVPSLAQPKMPLEAPPLWDGRAAERAGEVLHAAVTGELLGVS
jgi:UDP-N-acetylglucosamine 2-epimerase (non-hydrolysing)